jgi:hypothetical protein
VKSEGLTRVPSGELERLLKAIHRRTLESPISRSNLIACAFGHIEEHLGLLLGLDHTAAQRILVAVLAERRPRALRSGPPRNV